MRPALVLRPEPGNAATLSAARAAGLEAIASPLFAMRPVPWSLAAGREYDALLLGSANAIRLGGPALKHLLRLPVHAVGESTARIARAAGFAVAGTGSGGLQALLPRLVSEGRTRVLRLAGEEHVALSIPPGLQVETVVVYRAEPLELAAPAVSALARGAVAMLHSAEAARRLAALVDAQGIARGSVALACLGPRIAEAAGAGWAEVRAAPAPEDGALLAITAEMCQSLPTGVDRQD